MDMKMELYPEVISRLEKATAQMRNDKGISGANKEHLTGFLTSLEAKGTSPHQMVSYLDRLMPIARLLGDMDFKDTTRRDMERVYSLYRKEGGKRIDGKPMGYSPSSLNKAMQCIKCFYRWIYGLTSQDKAPDAVRWIPKEACRNKLRPEDLWTEQDMEKVMAAARSLRDKCILSVLFESGLRPGELRSLRIGDVVVNGSLVRLYVRGKTEKKLGERMVPIIRSYHIIRMWISQHPRRNDRDAWLWSFDDKPIQELALRIMFRNLAKKAGIAKPRNPYIMRHSALTRAYSKLPGTVASKLAGHAPGSREAQTYTHLAEDDLENAVLELNGLERKKEPDPVKCMKCGQSLGVGDRICPMCGLAQDQEAALLKADAAEEAAIIKAKLDFLSKKYPELGKMMSEIMKKELGP